MALDVPKGAKRERMPYYSHPHLVWVANLTVRGESDVAAINQGTDVTHAFEYDRDGDWPDIFAAIRSAEPLTFLLPSRPESPSVLSLFVEGQHGSLVDWDLATPGAARFMVARVADVSPLDDRALVMLEEIVRDAP